MRPEVTTDGRVTASTLVWCHRERAHITVVAHARFAIVPDGVAAHRGPGKVASDAFPEGVDTPYRPRCDVTLVGAAHMTRGTVDPFVRLGVAAAGRIVLDKVVRVAGASPGDVTPIPGLGPQPPRQVLARGKSDVGALEVADAIDWSDLQAAPADQQIVFPVGGEWLVLDGIDPRAPRVSTQLPVGGAEARIRLTDGPSGSLEATMRLACDAVAVDADRREITLVWRGVWPLPEGVRVESCRLAAGLAAPDAPIDWGALWARAMPGAPRAAPSTVEDSTLVGATGPLGDGAAHGLPFLAQPVVASAGTGVGAGVGVSPPPVDDATRPGATAATSWVAPFPIAEVTSPSSPGLLTGLPWGGPVKSAPIARPGDETVAVAPAPAPRPGESAAKLADRLREMAKDKDAIRKLMASLRGG